jgi:uncharacterized protein YndB with AHSA1/START domain
MKHRFTTEYEINASPKMIFPYLSSAGGLQEWFADEVVTLPDKTMNIIWDGVDHHAKVVSRRTNSHIKYQFGIDGNAEEEELGFLEFKVDYNEMTQSSFLKIVDYSEMDDENDLEELWNQLIGNLKEITGSNQ